MNQFGKSRCKVTVVHENGMAGYSIFSSNLDLCSYTNLYNNANCKTTTVE